MFKPTFIRCFMRHRSRNAKQDAKWPGERYAQHDICVGADTECTLLGTIIYGPRIYTATAFGEPSSDANFANYGPSVDFTMPGVVINSTLPGSQYGKKNGTSMAAPHLDSISIISDYLP